MNTLRDYFETLIRRWWMVVVAIAVCMAISILLSAAATPMYSSQAEVLVNQQSASDVFDPNASGTAGNATLTRQAANEARFIESDDVQLAAETTLGFEATIEASTQSGSDVITLTATSDDPRIAQSIAQTYAEAYLDERRKRYINDFVAASSNVQAQIDELDAQLLDGSRLPEAEQERLENLRTGLLRSRDELNIAADLAVRGSGQIIGLATLPEAPFSPRSTRNVVAGFGLGLLLGVGAALALEGLDQSFRLPGDLEAVTGLSNLALIQRSRGKRKNASSDTSVVSVSDPESLAAEEYRTLRAAIQFMAIDSDLRVVQVTSAQPGEGKTTVAANLAAAMASAGRTVALVDSDLRRPTLHERFGIAQEPGFSNVLRGDVEPHQAAVPVSGMPGELTVTPAGPLVPFPSELLSLPVAGDAFESLKELADVIVIDSPPVVPVADALVISGLCDATLLVVNGRATRRADVHQAMDLLEQVDAPLIGTVLNGVKRRRWSYGYSYGYGYGYGSRNRKSTNATSTTA